MSVFKITSSTDTTKSETLKLKDTFYNLCCVVLLRWYIIITSHKKLPAKTSLKANLLVIILRYYSHHTFANILPVLQSLFNRFSLNQVKRILTRNYLYKGLGKLDEMCTEKVILELQLFDRTVVS